MSDEDKDKPEKRADLDENDQVDPALSCMPLRQRFDVKKHREKQKHEKG